MQAFASTALWAVARADGPYGRIPHSKRRVVVGVVVGPTNTPTTTPVMEGSPI